MGNTINQPQQLPFHMTQSWLIQIIMTQLYNHLDFDNEYQLLIEIIGDVIFIFHFI